MIIRRIKAERFGCLQDVEVEFGAGLNVIKGLNEAGKSTLHHALLMALFARPTQKKSNEAYRAWGADKLFRLEVRFQGPDSKEWILCKDFEHNSTDLQSPDEEVLDDWHAVQERLASIIGTESISVFRSTVCVAQDELTDILAGRKDISQGLEEIVTGGDDEVHTNDAIHKLDDAIQRYRKGYTTHAPVRPGPIAQLVDQHEQYRELVDQRRPIIDRQAGDLQRRVEIEERLQQIEQDLDPKLDARAAADEAAELQSELAKERAEEYELDATIGRIDDATRNLEAAAEILAELKAVAELDDDAVTSLIKLNERIGLLEEQREAAAGESGGQVRDRPGTFVRIVGPVILAILGVVAVWGGIIIGLAADSVLLAIAGTVVGMIGVLAGAVWAIVASRVGRGQSIAAPRAFDEEKLSARKADFEHRLAEIDCSAWQEFETKRKRVEQARKDLRDAEVQLETMLPDDQTRESLEAKRAQSSRNRRDSEEKLAEPEFVHASNMDAVGFQMLSRDITDLISEQENLEIEQAVVKSRLSEETGSREDLLDAEEHLAQISERLEREKERLEVYELAQEMLQEARERTLVRAQDELGPLASEYFGELTGGRYTHVDVDADLNVKVTSTHKPDGPIDPSELSMGTRDQLYLALRLAIMGLLFPDTNPPVFLDDPFVKFDPQRQLAAVELCLEIAEGRQVLLFTCSNDYDDAGKMIELISA